ncbi:hypothetical protein ACEPAG_3921 [Sanghuangporus baumii]
MASNQGASQLDALVSLIKESVDVFKAECENAGVSVPVLNGQSSAEHDALREKGSIKLSKAVSIIEAACAQLCAVVARPELTLIKAASGHFASACMEVAATRDLATFLSNSPEGLHTSALSKATGVNEDHLSRILRLLATNHIFQEVGPSVFANNLVSTKLATSIHAKAIVETSARECHRASSYISEFLKYDNASPSRPESPFQLAYGLPLMDYNMSPEGKETIAAFMAGITGWGETAMVSDLWRSEFPWSEYLSKPFPIRICDVGAGEGHILLKLARALPDLRFHAILQDRPPVLELSKQIWNKELPEAVQHDRVDFVPIDFFTDSPVDGCEIYYIRHCIRMARHNWPDDKCVTILKNIAKAMRSKENSILLVHEIILRPAISQTSEENEATSGIPEPLLKNLGAAKMGEYLADISMMALLNSKERTLEEYATLGTMAGLAFDHIWDMEGCAMIQFSLKN